MIAVLSLLLRCLSILGVLAAANVVAPSTVWGYEAQSRRTPVTTELHCRPSTTTLLLRSPSAKSKTARLEIDFAANASAPRRSEDRGARASRVRWPASRRAVFA